MARPRRRAASRGAALAARGRRSLLPVVVIFPLPCSSICPCPVWHANAIYDAGIYGVVQLAPAALLRRLCACLAHGLPERPLVTVLAWSWRLCCRCGACESRLVI